MVVVRAERMFHGPERARPMSSPLCIVPDQVGPKSSKQGPSSWAIMPGLVESSCLSPILPNLACFVMSNRVVLFSKKMQHRPGPLPTISCSCRVVFFHARVVQGFCGGRASGRTGPQPSLEESMLCINPC